MSKKQTGLVGKCFIKYCPQRGVETFHVLAHHKKRGCYTVAFIENSTKPGYVVAESAGPIRGVIAQVQDWVVENYATYDQKKCKALLKLEKKRRKLAEEIDREAMADWNRRINSPASAPEQSSNAQSDNNQWGEIPF